MPAELLLRANEISYSNGQKLILDRVSFELYRGQITAIIGPNGAGKSTLTGIVNGLIDNYSGDIERQPGMRIGYLPQKVYVNTLMPVSVERILQLTRSVADKEVDAALAQAEVAYLKHRQVQSLSEGELKRVLLARTTLGNPDLIVLDEINIAMRYDYLSVAAVISGLDNRADHTSVILTGRDAKPELIEYADLVSEMVEVKHPFKSGIKAQRGIDF